MLVIYLLPADIARWCHGREEHQVGIVWRIRLTRSTIYMIGVLRTYLIRTTPDTPVLVHRIHVAQSRDDEVDDGSPRRDDSVVLARVVDLLGRVLRLRQPLVDGLGGDLGLG